MVVAGERFGWVKDTALGLFEAIGDDDTPGLTGANPERLCTLKSGRSPPQGKEMPSREFRCERVDSREIDLMV